MNYQLSPDQNTITVNSNTYHFIEKKPFSSCKGCVFSSIEFEDICVTATCAPNERKDYKTGIFQLKK